MTSSPDGSDLGDGLLTILVNVVMGRRSINLLPDTVPPGVEVMKQRQGQIAYTADNTAKGAQVRIVTKNAEALGAIHATARTP